MTGYVDIIVTDILHIWYCALLELSVETKKNELGWLTIVCFIVI